MLSSATLGMRAQVKILGVRHHSPACARLVQAQIAALNPKFVLIEGPSDYNARIDELLLGHELPIALYSFSPQAVGMAQCWFPFLEYSPEWVALQQGHQQHASVRFIDLPHWQYRTLKDTARTHGQSDGRTRYHQVVAALCQRFHCDADDALWDHLFESAPEDQLAARLEHYFALLRGDPLENHTEQDDAREHFMARYIAWAAAQCTPQECVIVICGGWHKAALELLWPTLSQLEQPYSNEVAAGAGATDERASDPIKRPGSYLVPYHFRQVDAMAGYASGMPSPMFYQWVWQADYQSAVARAQAAIVQSLRAKKVAVSTADLIALSHCQNQLAALRGHTQPMRVDLLDAVQSTLVKEALEAPPPWSAEVRVDLTQHPVLREALLALTGAGAGKLHADTPQPSLLANIDAELAAHALTPVATAREIILDRRDPIAQAQAIVLWRLTLLGCSSVKLQDISAPNAARALPKSLHFQERWQLQRNFRWHVELIEAAAFGADLETASLEKLKAQLHQAGASSNLAALSGAIQNALRAGFTDLSASLADEITAALPNTHDHGTLAQAIDALQQVQTLGFFGTHADALIAALLAPMLAHLLWLVDGLQASSPLMMDGDVQAIRCLFLQAQRLAEIDASAALPALAQGAASPLARSLARIAQRPSAPPSLRGAALGAAYQLGSLDHSSQHAHTRDAVLLQIAKAQSPRDQLGDFLFGLFAIARSCLSEQRALVAAIHQALEGMSTEDFLVALPQLRGAFTWFPPRERAKLAEHAAALLGIEATHGLQLLALAGGTQGLLHAKQIEAAVDAWAAQFGLAL